jgi:hypothetical protein
MRLKLPPPPPPPSSTSYFIYPFKPVISTGVDYKAPLVNGGSQEC